jgi:hypothetical protein
VKTLILALALGLAATGSSHAQAMQRSARPLTIAPDDEGWRRPRAAVVVVPLDPVGFVPIQTPFATVDGPAGPALVRVPHYRGPDGSYDSLTDLTQDINGIPCGVECTRRSLIRWGYRP